MRKTSIILSAVALLTLAAASANAQDDKRIHINFGGGPTIPTGPIGERFETGWGPAIGVTIDTPSRRLGFQFEYAYRWMGLNEDAISSTRSWSAATSRRTTRPISSTSTSSRT